MESGKSNPAFSTFRLLTDFSTIKPNLYSSICGRHYNFAAVKRNEILTVFFLMDYRYKEIRINYNIDNAYLYSMMNQVGDSWMSNCQIEGKSAMRA